MTETPWLRLGPDRFPPPPSSDQQDTRCRLLKHLHTERTIAFLGAGCTAPLGYPGWHEFVGRLVAKTCSQLDPPPPLLLRLAGRDAAATASANAARLMTQVALCKEALRADTGSDESYFGCLAACLDERVSRSRHNPYHSLLALPVTRFVTTNYDDELENALAAKRRLRFEEPAIGPPASSVPTPEVALSFTHEARDRHLIPPLALSAAGHLPTAVFHCHGRIDRRASIIASEEDYQQLYLASGTEGVALQRLLELLLQSNPVFFVGYGLADDDLLRPLRLLKRQHDSPSMPSSLFVLLRDDGTRDIEEECEYLRLRYRVQALTYEDTTGDGKSLCAALDELATQLDEFRDQWIQKPAFREPRLDAEPPRPYLHYAPAFDPEERLGDVDKHLEELSKRVSSEQPITVLVGPGGVGKSWHALRLIELLQSKEPQDQEWGGFFFWSSYYAYDTLTGLDRLVRYLDPGGSKEVGRFERIRKYEGRQGPKVLVVFDGFEKLLLPTDDPEVGRVYDPTLLRLLKLFGVSDTNLRLLLTSRLRPKELLPDAPLGRHTEFMDLSRLRPDQIEAIFPEEDLTTRSALCSLLDGHSYGLLLASRVLLHSEDGGEALSKLQRDLAATPPDSRLSKVIAAAIRVADDHTDDLALPLLERLALFMGAVGEATMNICWSLAAGNPEIGQDEAFERLREMRLAFFSETVDGSQAVLVHPTVRSHIFEYVHGVACDAPPNFTLPGFTSGNAAVYPGSERSRDLVEEMFAELLCAARGAVASDRIRARHLCRSLFALVRSRMEANTASRWNSYGDYTRLILEVLNLAKEVTDPNHRWTFCARESIATLETEDASLYADEVAWLYNDLGLALCSEGHMPDTYDLWEQGYEVNQVIEGTAELSRYTLQSQLHLAHTFLELGELALAAHYLEVTHRTNHHVQDPDYEGRILGYQGLLAHLRGDFDGARDLYAQALKHLKRAGGNTRAESYFLRHWAAVEIAVGRIKAARNHAWQSRARAESGGFPDMVAFSRSTQGGVYRASGRLELAVREYEAALGMARRRGVRRLESEVLGELARVSLALGDGSVALDRSLESLKIANQLGLGLRQTSSLLYFGQAVLLLGERDLGTACLRHCLDMAERQGYMLLFRRAEAELEALRVPSSERDSFGR